MRRRGRRRRWRPARAPAEKRAGGGAGERDRRRRILARAGFRVRAGARILGGQDDTARLADGLVRAVARDRVDHVLAGGHALGVDRDASSSRRRGPAGRRRGRRRRRATGRWRGTRRPRSHARPRRSRPRRIAVRRGVLWRVRQLDLRRDVVVVAVDEHALGAGELHEPRDTAGWPTPPLGAPTLAGSCGKSAAGHGLAIAEPADDLTAAVIGDVVERARRRRRRLPEAVVARHEVAVEVELARSGPCRASWPGRGSWSS